MIEIDTVSNQIQGKVLEMDDEWMRTEYVTEYVDGYIKETIKGTGIIFENELINLEEYVCAINT
jgi:hypothetical protein